MRGYFEQAQVTITSAKGRASGEWIIQAEGIRYEITEDDVIILRITQDVARKKADVKVEPCGDKEEGARGKEENITGKEDDEGEAEDEGGPTIPATTHEDGTRTTTTTTTTCGVGGLGHEHDASAVAVTGTEEAISDDEARRAISHMQKNHKILEESSDVVKEEEEEEKSMSHSHKHNARFKGTEELASRMSEAERESITRSICLQFPRKGPGRPPTKKVQADYEMEVDTRHSTVVKSMAFQVALRKRGRPPQRLSTVAGGGGGDSLSCTDDEDYDDNEVPQTTAFNKTAVTTGSTSGPTSTGSAPDLELIPIPSSFPPPGKRKRGRPPGTGKFASHQTNEDTAPKTKGSDHDESGLKKRRRTSTRSSGFNNDRNRDEEGHGADAHAHAHADADAEDDDDDDYDDEDDDADDDDSPKKQAQAQEDGGVRANVKGGIDKNPYVRRCVVTGCSSYGQGPNLKQKDAFGAPGARCMRHGGGYKTTVKSKTGGVPIDIPTKGRRCSATGCHSFGQGPSVQRGDTCGPPGPRCVRHGGGNKCAVKSGVRSCGKMALGTKRGPDAYGDKGYRCKRHGGRPSYVSKKNA